MPLSDTIVLRQQILDVISSKHAMDFFVTQDKVSKALSTYDFLQKVWQQQAPSDIANFFTKTQEDVPRTIRKSIDFLNLFAIRPVPFPELDKYTGWFNFLDGLTDPKQIEKQEKATGLLYELEYELLPKPEPSKHSKQDKEQRIILIGQTKRIREVILDIYRNNNKLLQVEPRQFEELIAELLMHQGFNVELTKQTRDGGYDLIALYEMNNQAPQRWLVECKRLTKGPVGVDIVRAFKEVVQSQAVNRGIIATTSYFSSDAIKKQQETPYLLDFRDKDAIMQWITNYACQA